jgi:hypothetical protein
MDSARSTNSFRVDPHHAKERMSRLNLVSNELLRIHRFDVRHELTVCGD